MELEEPVDLFFPFVAESANAFLDFLVYAIAFDPARKFFERDFGVRDDGQTQVLSCVELRHIDVDKFDYGILKSSLRSRGEIRIARTDSDDQVGVAGQEIRSGSAGNNDGAQVLRVIVGERPLSGLRLSHGNSGLFSELGKRSRCFRVKHAPVSAGEVITRITSGSAVRSCSGRDIRSQ